MDTDNTYLYAVKEKLSSVPIVVDKFHLIKKLNRKMDTIRKIIQDVGSKGPRKIPRFLLVKNKEELSLKERECLNNVWKAYSRFPALKALYVVKDKVRDMYRMKCPEVAKRESGRIRLLLEREPVGIIKETNDMLHRWEPYILNYFAYKTTNGIIQGLHNKVQLVKRISYGFRYGRNYAFKITAVFRPDLLGRSFSLNVKEPL